VVVVRGELGDPAHRSPARQKTLTKIFYATFPIPAPDFHSGLSL
jgi:hypothetical protein